MPLQELTNDGGPGLQTPAIPLLQHNLENCQPLIACTSQPNARSSYYFYLVDKWWANTKCYLLTTHASYCCWNTIAIIAVAILCLHHEPLVFSQLNS
jgi:hypothetical protein